MTSKIEYKLEEKEWLKIIAKHLKINPKNITFWYVSTFLDKTMRIEVKN